MNVINDIEGTMSEKRVKLCTLKVPQLNQLLENRGLTISGNKAAKITELTKALNSDEIAARDIPPDEIVIDVAEDNVRMDVSNLKYTMESLARTMQSLAKSVNDFAAQTQITPSTTGTRPPQPHCENSSDSRVNNFPIREIVEMLPEFNPLQTTTTASQFILKIRQLQQAYMWSDNITVLAAQQRLRGVAKTWLDAQPAFVTMNTFEEAIFEDFPSGNSTAECHKELMRRKRRYSESYVQYYYEMLAIGRRGGLDDRTLITYMIDGINDPTLAKTLAVMNIRVCRDLLASLENIDARPNTNTEILKCYNCKRHGHIAANCRLADFQPRYETPKNMEITQTREIICFNCNEKGHISRACQKPQRRQRCSYCQRTSHSSEVCPQRTENNYKRNSNVNTITDSADTYKDVVKFVKVNNYPCKAFMDSGSAISLIRETYANIVESITETHKVISSFAGGIYIATKKVNSEIEIDCNIYNTTLYVVPDEDLPEQILLGRDVICIKKIVVSLLKVKVVEWNW